MFSYRKPGVYFERLDRLRPFTQVRTDIAGFVGLARRGPLHRAVKLESWQQFFSVFGGVSQTAPSFLSYAVRGFFDNGGRECWVVRVANPVTAAPATFSVTLEGSTPWGLEASSPGTWGRELQIELRRTGGSLMNITIRLPQGDGEVRQVWRNLPLNDRDALRERIEESELDVRWFGADEQSTSYQRETRRTTERLIRFIDDAPMPTVAEKRAAGQGGRTLARDWVVANGAFMGGDSGLSGLMPAHFSGDLAMPEQKWGLSLFKDIDEISLLAMPDMMPFPHSDPSYQTPALRCDQVSDERQRPPSLETEYARGFGEQEIEQLQFALIRQCEQRLDRFAILDVPPSRQFPETVIEWRNKFDTSRAALYFPWVKVSRPQGGRLVEVPTCGHVAGIYARGDIDIGVHKPPANMLMEDVKDLVFPIDDVLHGVLNEHQINVLRAVPGRGIRIGGAVTLSSDTLLRYINVRRLLLWIEEVIEDISADVVFEPNNPDQWEAVERITRGFLDQVWRAGMLGGATAEAAYRVRCDATTNPPEDTDRGLLQTHIDLLLPAPAEYVLVRIGKVQGGTEIEIGERRSERRSS